MKLLHVSPSYYPAFRFGGPIQSVHLLNKTLVQNSVEVDVLTTNAGLSKSQIAEHRGEWVKVDNVRVKYLSFVGYEHYNFSLTFVWELIKIIRQYDFIHITAVWNFPVLAAALCAIYNNKPYIISTRGSLYKETIEFKSTILKKIYFLLFAKYFINKASVIHFTSEDEKIKVINYLNLKTPNIVIPNGVDLDEINQIHSKNLIYKFGLNGKKKYILILGRIDKKKGFDLLIPAFRDVIKNERDLILVIAGDDKTVYANTVRKLIADYQVSNNILFTGQVTGNDKWALYKNAQMFVLPSYSENFGMSIVESMACQCPVVISDKVGIYKDIEKARAGVIINTSSESIKTGILQLLNNESLRIETAANGKMLAANIYDIKNIAKTFLHQYNQLIN